MVGWHHWLDGDEFEQASGVSDGQGSLVWCCPRGCKQSDTTEWLNWTDRKHCTICLHVCVFSHVRLFETPPWTVAHQALNFAGNNTGMSCHFLLQGIFLIHRSNPHLLHLPHWQEDSLPLSHQGSKESIYHCSFTPASPLLPFIFALWSFEAIIWVKRKTCSDREFKCGEWGQTSLRRNRINILYLRSL